MKGSHFIVFPCFLGEAKYFILRENFSHFIQGDKGGLVVLKNGTTLQTSLNMWDFNLAIIDAIKYIVDVQIKHEESF